jgi:cytochrome c6
MLHAKEDVVFWRANMRMNFRKLLLCAAAFAAAVILTPTVHAQSAADVYKTKCASCHGADGKGSAIGKKLGVKAFSDPEVAKSSDQTWTDITKKGKGKMPAFDGKLTDAQIKELVQFMRSLSK